MNIYENILGALSSSDNNSCHIHIRYVIAFSAIMREKNSHDVCVFDKMLTGICFVLFCFFFSFNEGLHVPVCPNGQSW